MITTLNNHEDAAQLEQGDIIKVTLNPTVGHEQQDWRPCVVLSVQAWNAATRGLILICPLTSNTNPNPNMQALWIDATQTDCGVYGSAMLDQIRSIDVVGRQAKKVGRVIDQQAIDHLSMGLSLIVGVNKSFFGDDS